MHSGVGHFGIEVVLLLEHFLVAFDNHAARVRDASLLLRRQTRLGQSAARILQQILAVQTQMLADRLVYLDVELKIAQHIVGVVNGVGGLLFVDQTLVTLFHLE